MKKIIFLLIAASITCHVEAADGEYAVNKIPEALLKHAHAVIRKEEQWIEVKSIEKMVIKNKFAITVFDETGDEYALLREHYDKFTDIESMDGTLYDVMGKKIRSLKKSEIKDMSMGSEGSLAVDSRMKSHDFYYKVYPYTVEYESEVTKKETMFFPNWNPIWTQNFSVEQSFIRVTVPKNYLFRFRKYNCDAPVVKDNGDKTEYYWEVKNLPAIEKEYAAPGWHEIAPYIVMAPSEFQIEDYKGMMTDWKEYGKFQTSLNKGRDVLPDAIKQKVHQLTDALKSNEEKVYALYNYLQANTRYISVQLGIGGWRPFEASYVAANAYGDCKALSNYMVALLKEAGIRGLYTLIRAGEGKQDILSDFPSSQFNHAIACVPNGSDTIWLECTSQTTPAGYMGGFTGNRHALVITEDGGKVVTTPKYSAKENLQDRKIVAEIDEQGNLKARTFTKYKAVQQDDLHGMINALSKEKVMDYLKSEIDLPNYDVQKFDYKEEKGRIPSITETLELTGGNYASVSGKRIFLSPNLLSKTHRKLTPDDTRKYDVRLTFEYTDVDSVEIRLPEGYVAESLPMNVNIENKFGNYSSSMTVQGNTVIYYRRIEQKSGRFPAADYNELVKYYDLVYKSDRAKVVLVKKD